MPASLGILDSTSTLLDSSDTRLLSCSPADTCPPYFMITANDGSFVHHIHIHIDSVCGVPHDIDREDMPTLR
jgi:hypothetical protein